MAIVDFPLDKPIMCSCGQDIEEFSMGYGRTPYVIQCSFCKKSLDDFFPSGVGWSLGDKHAVEGFQDFSDAIQWLKENKQSTSPERLCEYFYRKYKGWPENPTN